MLENRHIMWGLISKLLQRAFSWHPWLPGTLKLDLILSLFKCVYTTESFTRNLNKINLMQVNAKVSIRIVLEPQSILTHYAVCKMRKGLLIVIGYGA